MEHRESHLTHRQPSNKASLGWLLVCTVGAALFAVMIATQGALAQDSQDPSDGWFQKCGPVLDNPQTPEVLKEQENTIRSSPLASSLWAPAPVLWRH